MTIRRFPERLRAWSSGYVIPWRCVWAGHRYRPTPPGSPYAFACVRPGCSMEMTPGGWES